MEINLKQHVFLKVVMFFVFNYTFKQCNSADLLTEARLQQDLFKNYNPKVRPVRNPKTVMKVLVRMYLLRIGDLSEKHQVLTSSIWMDISWTDQLLSWNQSKYDGVEFVLADKEKIWTPDLLVQNEIGNKRGIGETTLNDPIVMSHGLVTWWPGKQITTTCKVDSTKYPFDTQYCEIEISKWYSNDNVLNITSDFGSVDLTHYEQSEEWDILETYATKQRHFEANQNFSRIKYGMRIKRRPLFYILNIIVPLMILSVLNQLCFLLPIESGEKIGMCMSIFLTYVVFLTLISGTLPQSSIHIPIFGAYLVFQLVISGFIIGLEVIVLHTYHKHLGPKETTFTNCSERIIDKSTGNNHNETHRMSSLSEHADNNIGARMSSEQTKNKNAARLDKILGYMVLGINVLALVFLFVIFQA